MIRSLATESRIKRTSRAAICAFAMWVFPPPVGVAVVSLRGSKRHVACHERCRCEDREILVPKGVALASDLG